MDQRLEDAAWLRLAYETRTLADIAAELRCHRNTVRNRLIAFGIARRRHGEHFRGKPKSPEQRAKMSEARKAYWANHGDQVSRDEHRLKVSQAKTIHGLSQGYRRIFTLEQRAVHEHRIVVEKMIGRPLQPGEHVHHKDKNRTNNNPDNLEVLTATEHAARHFAMRERDSAGRLI